MILRLLLLVVLSLTLAGCGTVISLEQLKRTSGFPSVYRYRGSDESYHYLKHRDLSGAQYYMVPREQLKVEEEFPRGTPGRSVPYLFLTEDNILTNSPSAVEIRFR